MNAVDTAVDSDRIHEEVRDHYARAAVSVQDVSAKLAAVSERLSSTVTEFIRKVGAGEARAAA